ncbi:MAG TPA: pitrilysin family protein, partial [Bacteroidales bacterium]
MAYQYHTLNNSIRIIHRFEKSNVSHVGLMVNTGTRDETEKESGMAHFIEHMVFKGTKKRSSWHVLSRIENVGGEMNAFTTKEETCLHASFHSPFYENCIELFSDITFHSVFPDKEIKKEKDVIIDEINSYNDNPSELIYDDFEGQLFKNHALGHNILGSLETVEKFSRQDIFRFINKNYSTNQMVLASVGDIDFKKLVMLAEKYFGAIPKSEKETKRIPFTNYQPEQKRFEKDSYLTHLIMGNLAYPRSHPKKSGMVLLNNLLGGPAMNTRLNLAIREKHGIGYTIESAYQPYSDTGVFAIYLGIDKKQLEKSIFLVNQELKKLREVKLGSIQLHRLKRQAIGQFAIGNESRLNEMLGIAKSHLYKPVVRTIEEIITQIEKVSAEDLIEVANEIF